MDQHRFDIVTRLFSGVPSRRHLLRGLAAAGLGWGTAQFRQTAEAKSRRKRKQQSTKDLCQKNGSRCNKPGKQCKRKYCLRAPFTIEATWTQTADHESYLFVPPQNATTGPFPFIDPWCTPDRMPCEEAYPYACVDNDEQ